jgi:hypothetical protein
MRDDAKAKDVAFSAVCLLAFPRIFNDLWSHVSHRPASFVGFDANCLIQVEGEAKVDDERFKVGQVYEYILWFEVAVDDVSFVNVPNPLEYLFK